MDLHYHLRENPDAYPDHARDPYVYFLRFARLYSSHPFLGIRHLDHSPLRKFRGVDDLHLARIQRPYMELGRKPRRRPEHDQGPDVKIFLLQKIPGLNPGIFLFPHYGSTTTSISVVIEA